MASCVDACAALEVSSRIRCDRADIGLIGDARCVDEHVTVGEDGRGGASLFGFAQFAYEAATPGAELRVVGFEVWGEKGDDGGAEVPQRIGGDAFVTIGVVVAELGDQDWRGIGHEFGELGTRDDDGGEPATLGVVIGEFVVQEGCRGVGVRVQKRDAFAGVGEPAGSFIQIIAIEAFDGDGEEAGRGRGVGEGGEGGEVAAEDPCRELPRLPIGGAHGGFEGGVGGEGDGGIRRAKELAQGVGRLPAVPLA